MSETNNNNNGTTNEEQEEDLMKVGSDSGSGSGGFSSETGEGGGTSGNPGDTSVASLQVYFCLTERNKLNHWNTSDENSLVHDPPGISRVELYAYTAEPYNNENLAYTFVWDGSGLVSNRIIELSCSMTPAQLLGFPSWFQNHGYKEVALFGPNNTTIYNSTNDAIHTGGGAFI